MSGVSALRASVGVSGRAWEETIEDLDDLPFADVALGLVLGVDELSVDVHIEDSPAAGDQAHVFDHVLIVAEKLLGYAHGVGRVVSRNAVGDLDAVAGHGRLLGWMRREYVKY